MSKEEKIKSKYHIKKRDNLINSEISRIDEYLFHEGKHFRAYVFMGAHFTRKGQKKGVRFITWAPKATNLVIVGDFNGWKINELYAMKKINKKGLWYAFIDGINEEEKYKFAVSNNNGESYTLKSDPYAFKSELRPHTASILVKNIEYKWNDKDWLRSRTKRNMLINPMNIYELHVGSWKTKENEFMTYYELANILPEYIAKMNYTHVEFMPLNEYPLDASWGYQATGYYSVTSRYGNPDGLKYLVDKLHANNIGVILDWVPGHFCKDEHGLYMFDGSPTYEYDEKWRAENKGWGTNNFDLGKPEVRSFLISNAIYFIREFHIDGLRVDAVSNMLYRSYGRNDSEWKANIYGGSESLEGESFFVDLNKVIINEFPGVITIAEESTTWPNITKDINKGGLGFTFKWNMGWMNDTLQYIEADINSRKYNHTKLNFTMMYNYSEKFILPISHDEVVHGKKALVDKMWGDYWNKFAGLRLYATFMITHPGKKLMFMGCEFGQFIEWREYEELEWKLIDGFEMHKSTQVFFKELNKFYLENKALWQLDHKPKGFNWIEPDNSEQSILIYMRRCRKLKDTLIVICNFTPNTYHNYKIGVPSLGVYEEVFNSDSLEFGGSDQKNQGMMVAEDVPYHNQDYTLHIKVPPMGAVIFKRIT